MHPASMKYRLGTSRYGHKYVVHKEDISATCPLFCRCEPGAFEGYLILGLLDSGNTFIDVGANYGYNTVLASSRVGSKGKVIAIEPAPDNYRLLRTNIALNHLKNTSTLLAALSDIDGDATLNLSGKKLGRHSFAASNVPEWEGIVKVRTMKADTVLEEVDRIDFMKIDVEGAETLVLCGGQNVLPRTRYVWIELWPDGLVAVSNQELLQQVPEEFCPYLIDLVGPTIYAGLTNRQIWETAVGVVAKNDELVRTGKAPPRKKGLPFPHILLRNERLTGHEHHVDSFVTILRSLANSTYLR